MTEPEDMDRIITALLKAPEKRLLIIEIANTIPIVNGDLDYAELANRQLEINLAIAEAKVYGAHTLMAVDSFVRFRVKREA